MSDARSTFGSNGSVLSFVQWRGTGRRSKKKKKSRKGLVDHGLSGCDCVYRFPPIHLLLCMYHLSITICCRMVHSVAHERNVDFQVNSGEATLDMGPCVGGRYAFLAQTRITSAANLFGFLAQLPSSSRQVGRSDEDCLYFLLDPNRTPSRWKPFSCLSVTTCICKV